MIVTTAEAARMVGVSTAAVRQWVARGYLVPIASRARPLTFAVWDVWRCAGERMPRGWHERIEAAAEAWRRACHTGDDPSH